MYKNVAILWFVLLSRIHEKMLYNFG